MSEDLKGRAYHAKRHAALKTARVSYDAHWRDLVNYIQPRNSRFFQAEARTPGEKKNQRIINNTAGKALRTLSAGMMAGITSPARPWFRLTTPDPDQASSGRVPEWLELVQMAILAALAKSNVYKSLHGGYGDLGLVGTSCGILEEDTTNLVRAYSVPPGEYCLAASDRGQVDTVYRETTLSVRQLVQKFGLDACSDRVRSAYSNQNLDEMVEVVHVIEPREVYDPSKADPKNMPWASCWFEKAGSEDGYLRESGYRECPILAPRWTVLGNDTYGSSPGMDALGDVKALQLLERRKSQGAERIIDPPLMGPGALLNRQVSLLPGQTTFADMPGQKLEAIYSPPPAAIQIIETIIREHEQRIEGTFYADLWLMLSQDEQGSPITAREVAERHEEKMLQLGPVMERLEDELLTPLVDRVFGILLRAGRLPKPPPELQGQDLRVEYLSIMAQAQKMVIGSGVQQFASFVGSVAAVKPEVLDKVDTDLLVTKYADALGVDPALLVPDDKVAQIRAQRAQQQAQAAQAQQQIAAAQAAKNLAGADTSGDNALTRMVGGVAAAQAGGGQ